MSDVKTTPSSYVKPSGTELPTATDKEGNKILYHHHGGMPEYKVDGETVYIMSQNEVLSIVEE